MNFSSLPAPFFTAFLVSSATCLVGCGSEDDPGTPPGGAGSGQAGVVGVAGAPPIAGASSGGKSGGVGGAPVAGSTAGGAGSGAMPMAGASGSGAGGSGAGGSGAGGSGAGGNGGNGVGGGSAGTGAGATSGAAPGGSGGTTGGASGSAGTAGSGGGAAPRAGSGGSGTAGGSGAACPANASFCSGFEDASLPKGAVYKLNGDPATPWTHDFEVDTTVKKSGNSSLRVRANMEASGAYKMLAVPTPGPAFWVRFYIRSDVDLGASDHNVYAMAAGSDDPNDSSSVEFAEDVGIAFNSHDKVAWPMGYGRTQAGGVMPFTLPKDTWHCIEVSFDGPGKTQQLFINGMQQINATGYPDMAYTFKTFKFGYNALHGTNRKTWYDDVAVASARIGCL